eukprot:TRINITY_DN4784_c0_g1_i1.p1 TRINITY_DN4784_c0_g1~~TRINITY_DN4784_c0_g1_i1.p1  ORF type:complete len:273 (+),score=41.16 TRINITY_DN4784_c0_g1_i1:109-819(+)
MDSLSLHAATASVLSDTSGAQRSTALASRIPQAKPQSQRFRLSSNRSLSVQIASRPRLVCSASATTTNSVEKVEWTEKRAVLLQNKVKGVSPQEAKKLVATEGYVILDVRPAGEFKEGRPEGAKNVEIYRLIKNWTAWDILRRAGFAFFGIFNGTEENPDFLAGVAAAGLTPASKIIVACSPGGTLKPSQNFPEGKESRSLIAAYALTLGGFKSVLHIEGGLTAWFREGLPVEGDD